MSYKDLAKRRECSRIATHKYYRRLHPRKPTSKHTERTREQLAWVAGLFEGEGCFCMLRSKWGLYPRAVLIMTDFDRVIKLCDVLGFGNLQLRAGRLRLGGRCKEQLEWNACSFEQFQATVALLWTWLGPRRRKKAKELLVEYYAYHRS